MFEIFDYEFMQRAFIVGISLSLLTAVLGSFIVLKRYAMLPDALSHIALLGVGIGLVTHTSPIYVPMVVAVIAGIAIEYLRYKKRLYSDAILSIFLSGALAMAIVLKTLLSSTAIFADISLLSCALISTAVLLFYSVTGGIIASVYTDLIQGAVMERGFGLVGGRGWTEPAKENQTGAAGPGASLVPPSNHRPPTAWQLPGRHSLCSHSSRQNIRDIEATIHVYSC